MKKKEISIIIPACNEESNLPVLVERIDETFKKNNIKGEVIIVDDGSTDNTWRTLEALKKRYSYLYPLKHPHKLGITAALNTATSASKNDILIFLPADLQSDPREDVPKLLSKMNEGNYDIVVGRRDAWNRPLTKIIESKIYSLILRFLFRVPINDFNWVRVFKRETAKHLHLRKDWHRYFVVIASKMGFKVGEVGVNEYPRISGKSKFNFLRVITGFLDLLVIWFYLHFTKKPMLFFGTIGILSFAIGSVLGLLLIYLYLIGSQEVTTRPILFLLTILILGGIQSFIFGFLAELHATTQDEIHSLFEQLRKKG
ncbi:MAG: glycosyltransferase family 2 protein [Candidatus Anstonellales archaeon]